MRDILGQAATIDLAPLLEQQVAGFAGPIRQEIAELGGAHPGSPRQAATDSFFFENGANLTNVLMYAAYVRSMGESLTLSKFVYRTANDFDAALAKAYALRDVPSALARFLEAPRGSAVMVRGGIERTARQILTDALLRMGLVLHGRA